MGGERENIKQLAELVSKDVLSVFGWKRRGPTDENWECKKPKAHGSQTRKKKSHSTDVVFEYIDPYRAGRTYLNTDLKSYGRDSITSSSISSALQSLVYTTECAQISDEFRDRHIANPDAAYIAGLLFIYNHDNEFDDNFDQLVAAACSKVAIPPRVRAYILGPKQVTFLQNIAHDQKLVMASELEDFARTTHRAFPSPQLGTRFSRDEISRAAPIELLQAPILVIRTIDTNSDTTTRADVYIRDTVNQTEDILFILEKLISEEVLRTRGPAFPIHLREAGPGGADLGRIHLEHAAAQLLERFAGVEEAANMLNRVQCRPLANVLRGYSPMVVGMGGAD